MKPEAVDDDVGDSTFLEVVEFVCGSMVMVSIVPKFEKK